jgi:hypothetical protein
MHSFLLRVIVVASVLLPIVPANRAETPRATVTFDNKSGQPALVKLIGPSRRTALVPNRQKRTVTAVGGRYYILTATDRSLTTIPIPKATRSTSRKRRGSIPS